MLVGISQACALVGTSDIIVLLQVCNSTPGKRFILKSQNYAKFSGFSIMN